MGGVHAGEAVEKSGFAGTVWSNQGDNLALADAQIKVIQGTDAAEIHGQAADVKQ